MSESLPPTKRHLTRQLRERKHRKLYSDDWALGDEELEGGRGFNLGEKLDTEKFDQPSMVCEMLGQDLTVGHLQRHGFNTPLVFKDKAGLGLRVPTKKFSINDVRMCVGSRRVLDVMDVNTQKNVEMTMKEWQRYYEEPEKQQLLNVISLEFSHTKLENYVQSPTIVRQLDWVDVVWPRKLKESQIESTNLLEDMMYPKVRKYCLMSVKNCYTDFHVDFGGTSVWYHILKGSKVFWLIPPTESNLQLYEKWVLSGKQSDVFFGDTVEKCARVQLTEGNTFFIPTGWIHAVFTPCDSLVFGGNFLHSFGIEKQLKIAQVEDTTKVPQKFRYPFFTEMLWYVLERYVHTLLGRSHLEGTIDGTEDEPKPLAPPPIKPPHIHLTQQELHGLKAIVMYLHSLPSHKKAVPELLRDAVALIRDVRSLVEQHRSDCPESAATGKPVLTSPDENDNKLLRVPLARSGSNLNRERKGHPGVGRPPGSGKKSMTPPSNQNHDKNNQGPRRRRTRCKKCEACQRSDCGECSFCLDMVKFGGPGRAKQTCNMRQCLQPMLPITATCTHCSLDGWGQTPVTPQAKPTSNREGQSALMECSVCYEIAHPLCVQRVMGGMSSGVVNEDLPNSWECPLCCRSGKNTDYRPRHFRARQKSSDIRRMSVSSDASSAIEHKHVIENEHDVGGHSSGSEVDVEPTNGEIKLEIKNENSEVEIKKRKSEEGIGIPIAVAIIKEQVDAPRKLALRTQLAQQLSSNSSKVLKKPMYVIRPAQVGNPAMLLNNSGNLALDNTCLLAVFRHLPQDTLVRCALVCKTWARVSIDPLLWKKMKFTQSKLSAMLLTGIVRRQPESLVLDWTTIAKRQLAWLIARLPALKSLSLQGSPVQGVLGLRTCYCPPLNLLDLSFVQSLNDSGLRDILSPPQDSRPGLADSKSRLRFLKTLKLAGTDITDVALRYVTQHLPLVTNLDLSQCQRITDAGIAQLATSASAITTLVYLNLSGCKLITEVSLDHLSRCQVLTRLDLRHAPQVSTQAVIKFAAKSKLNLQVRDVKLVDKRRIQV